MLIYVCVSHAKQRGGSRRLQRAAKPSPQPNRSCRLTQVTKESQAAERIFSYTVALPS